MIAAPFYRDSFTLMSGSLVAQVFLLLISPILASMYTPEQFGVYGSFLAITSILAMIATGRFELAILLPKDNKNGYYLFFLSVFLAIIFSVFIFIFIGFTSSFSFWEKVTLLSNEHLFLIPIGILLFSITMPAAFLVNRLKDFKILSFSKMTGSGSTGIFALLFGAMGFTLSGLLFSKLLGWLIESATLIFPVWKKIKTVLYAFDKTKLFNLAKRYKNFPKFSTPEGLLNTGFKQIPIFALAIFSNPDLAGFYTLTIGILSKPFGMVSTSLGHVFYQKATEEKQAVVLKGIFTESLKFLFLLAIIPTVILFIFAPQVFSWIYGDLWETSGYYARWLLPFLFVTYLKSPFSGMVDIKNKFVTNLFFEVGFMVISIIAFTLGYWQNDDLLAIKIFSIANSVLGLFQLFWFRRLIDQETNW